MIPGGVCPPLSGPPLRHRAGAGACERLSDLLVGERLRRALEDLPADDAAVRGEGAGLAAPANPVEVPDRPVQLLKGVLRRATPALHLVVRRADGSPAVVVDRCDLCITEAHGARPPDYDAHEIAMSYFLQCTTANETFVSNRLTEFERAGGPLVF